MQWLNELTAAARLALIMGAVAFGIELGIRFPVAMITLAGGSIPYQTQVVMRRYPPQAHVAAARLRHQPSGTL